MSVGRIVSAPFVWVANTKFLKKTYDKFQNEPITAAATATIASIIIKDAIGCAMYVTQSLNNEKIPEERRSFVAALDLTNGSLMILAQVLLYLLVSSDKAQSKIFPKLFKKFYGPEAKEKYYMKMRDITVASKEKIYETFAKNEKLSKDVFKAVSSLVAATMLGKRVIVPFIATPMATWAKDNIIEKGKNKDKAKAQAETDTVTLSTKNTVSDVKEPNDSFKGNLLNKYIKK